MHALPVALATAAERAGASFRYGCAVERIVLRDGTTGPVRGVRLAGGELLAADAVVANPDLPVVYRTLLPGLDPPRVVAQGPVLALGRRVARRRHGRAPRRASSTTTSTSARPGTTPSAPLLRDGRRMPDPSILVSVPSLREPGMAPPGGHVLYVLEPVPNLDGAVDWTVERGRARDDLARRVAALGYRLERRGGGLRRPAGLGGRTAWSGARRSPCRTASSRPVRSGPGNVERRAPGLVFCGSGTVPGVGVPMVLVSGMLAAAPRRRLMGARMTTLEESYARCRALARRHGTTYYWSTHAPARGQAPPRVGALRLLPPRRRHRRRPGPGAGRASGPRRSTGCGERFLADLAAGRSDDPVLRRSCTPCAPSASTSPRFERFLALDGDGPHRRDYETWDDLLGYMDGSAAVIGEMLLPILEPTIPEAVGPGPRPRVRVPAHELPARRRRGPRPGTGVPAAGGPRALRRRSPAPRRRRAVAGAACASRSTGAGPCTASADEGIALLPPASARCVRRRPDALQRDPRPHRGPRLRRVHGAGHASRPGASWRWREPLPPAGDPAPRGRRLAGRPGAALAPAHPGAARSPTAGGRGSRSWSRRATRRPRSRGCSTRWPRQDHPPAEIVVVDDESTDGTGAVRRDRGEGPLLGRAARGLDRQDVGLPRRCRRGDRRRPRPARRRHVAGARRHRPPGRRRRRHGAGRAPVGAAVPRDRPAVRAAVGGGQPRRRDGLGHGRRRRGGRPPPPGGVRGVPGHHPGGPGRRGRVRRGARRGRRGPGARPPLPGRGPARAGPRRGRHGALPHVPRRARRSLVEGWTKNLAAGAWRGPVLPVVGTAVWVTGALSVGVRVGVRPGLTVAARLAALRRPAGVGAPPGRVASAGGPGRCSRCPWPPSSAWPSPRPSPASAGRVTWRGRRVALGH